MSCYSCLVLYPPAIINHVISDLLVYLYHSMQSSVDKNEEIFSVKFCTFVKVKLLREKIAYLLKELLEDEYNI